MVIIRSELTIVIVVAGRGDRSEHRDDARQRGGTAVRASVEHTFGFHGASRSPRRCVPPRAAGRKCAAPARAARRERVPEAAAINEREREPIRIVASDTSTPLGRMRPGKLGAR